MLYQAGLLISMLQGVYEGDVNFKTLSEHGDTGLGTLDGVDGEMIAVDGIYYRIDAQGVASIIPPEKNTPFAVVSHFIPEKTIRLENIPDLETLEKQLDAHLENRNIFYMLRLETELDWIKLRSESCQPKPYRPMIESLPALQTVFEIQPSRGILIATRCPLYAAQLNVPGYHFHYLDQQKKTGGHVFDLKVKKAKIMIQSFYTLTVAIFRTQTFAKANLEIDIEAATHQVEKKPI